MTTTAFEQAQAEGLSYFWARTHINPTTVYFVGHAWQDGGYSVNTWGDPETDARGNTVAQYGREELDANNPDHVAQVAEWWS